jgi:hypothetical protein
MISENYRLVFICLGEKNDIGNNLINVRPLLILLYTVCLFIVHNVMTLGLNYFRLDMTFKITKAMEQNPPWKSNISPS